MKKLNTTFFINGGAGRVISSIPALEKYYKLNPKDDFKVLIHGWEYLFWNHPILQNKTFGINQKGIFDLFIKNNNFISPEPYHLYSYYNQQKNLIQTFDEIINKTNNHLDLNKPNLYLHSNELNTANDLIKEAKLNKRKNKFIVLQPYGSGAQQLKNNIIDSSNRSMYQDDVYKLIKLLSNDAVVLYMGPKEFTIPNDQYSINANNMPNIDLRFYMAMIAQCDYFIGIDSVGQHIARSFNKNGLIIMGATHEKNVSYPDHFNFYRKPNTKPYYSPLRMPGIDAEYSDRLNDNIMKFDDSNINEIYELYKSNS